MIDFLSLLFPMNQIKNLCKICNLPLEKHTNTQLKNCDSLDKISMRIKNGGVTQAIERKLLEKRLTK